MVSAKNIVIAGAGGMPICLDIFYAESPHPKPVFLYAHGFNGFKDWGNFDLMAAPICRAGFVLVKFNFSHNGTSPEAPESFVNLDSFAENNYSKQLFDLRTVVDWLCDPGNEHAGQVDSHAICLVGHSMGGGISILYAAEDSRIHKLVTWAAISECKTPWGSWSPEKMKEWKETGVAYYHNSRTGQEMPMHYQLYEDFVQHEDRLDIQKALAGLSIPVLICHGSNDTSVGIRSAEQLKAANPAATLFILNTDHVFGRKHPWPHSFLPAAMDATLRKTLDFLRS